MYTYVYIIHGYAKPIIIRSHHNGESVRKSPSYRNHRLCIYLYLERALRGDNFRKALHTYIENRNVSLEKRNVLKLSAPSIDLFLLLRNRACPRGRWARKVEKQIYIRAGIERRLHSEASYVALLPRRKKCMRFCLFEPALCICNVPSMRFASGYMNFVYLEL